MTVRWRACPWHAVKVGHFWIPWSYFRFFRLVFERTPPREFIRSASQLVSTVMTWSRTNAVLFVTVRWRSCPWRAVKVGRFEFRRLIFAFFALYLNELLLGNLLDLLHNWSVQSKNGAQPTPCYLWLYVEGRGRGVPSKLAVLNSVVLFSLFSPCIWTNSS